LVLGLGKKKGLPHLGNSFFPSFFRETQLPRNILGGIRDQKNEWFDVLFFHPMGRAGDADRGDFFLRTIKDRSCLRE
jgi:hypothetical protein